MTNTVICAWQLLDVGCSILNARYSAHGSGWAFGFSLWDSVSETDWERGPSAALGMLANGLAVLGII